MAKRKTVNVAFILDLHADMTDAILKNYAPNEIKPRLEALNIMVETVLHDTGNYKGFRYLDESEKPRPEARHYY